MELASRVHIISKQFSHHSNYSGYDRLIDFIPSSPSPALPISYLFSNHYKEVKVSKCTAKVDHYGITELNNELDIMWYLNPFQRHLFHFIYSENTFCYSADRNRNNKIFLGSVHQPESWFKAYGKTRYEYFTSKVKLLDGVIAVSSNQADFLREFNNNVYCIHHGIDVDFFTPGTDNERDPNLCLFVGNWLRDFETLKECAKIMQSHNSKIKIHVVTPEKNRSLLVGSELEIYSGVSDYELRDKYRKASIALLPLKDCTANNSALEAMACGLPIVVSDIGGIRDYATEDFAVFCRPGCAEEMVAAVFDLILRKEKLHEMGNAARLRAETHFAWPIVADKMIEVYKLLLLKNGRLC